VCQSKILAISVCDQDVNRLRDCLDPDLEVEAVTLGEAATHLEHDECPGVVIFDIEGNPDWPSDLQELLSVRPPSRVILLSRLADDCLWMDALDAGAHDLIMKPFDKQGISSVVRSALLHSHHAAA